MAKKTKRVDTPIDQRETFVSIQKNFADSELSVEEKLRTLYDLQQADSEIVLYHGDDCAVGKIGIANTGLFSS